MKDIVVGLGEALWDMLPEGKKIGGAPANFAYHASQFGFNTMAISAVGEDKLGDETLAALDEKKLHYIMPRIPFPTGVVLVNLDDKGVPTYQIKENVAWDNIPFTEEMAEVARNCRAVCFGSLAQRNVASRQTIHRFLDTMPDGDGRLKIFDINLRQHFYNKEVICESLNRCNVLKINDEELEIVARIFGYTAMDMEKICCAILEEYHLEMLVLTCGVNGSYVFTPGEMSFLPTPKVPVADTVGAGDSFTGSFCAAVLKGMPIREAHCVAVEVSAFVCTQNGAMPKLPDSILEKIK